MMTNLLHENLGSIIHGRLEGLSQDGIEWLIKHVTWVTVTKGGDHHHFHSLHRVCGQCGSIQISWHMDTHGGNQLQDSLVTHALDGETD
jgi:hypothetical protein